MGVTERAANFKGWRDAKEMRPPMWEEHWSQPEKKAYESGYEAGERS
jgi:hypothetical protein